MLAKIQKTLKIDVKVEEKGRKMSKNSDKTPKIGYPVLGPRFSVTKMVRVNPDFG